MKVYGPSRVLLIVLPILLAFAACGPSDAGRGSGGEASVTAAEALEGRWRGVLESPGGELPFGLEIAHGADGGWSAEILNGEERAEVSGVEVDGQEVRFAFDTYDAEIVATLSGGEDGGPAELNGRWSKTVPGGMSELGFHARRGEGYRFQPGPDASGDTPVSVAGVWSVRFQDENGTEPARAELDQDGATVTGTFLTPTGDYRFLAGRYEGGHLRLSTFDGAHAFLFHARAGSGAPDTLEGDFWSRDTYHATWTAERTDDPGEASLPDPWSQVQLTNDEGRFRFAFPDLDGETLAQDDPRFAGKVVLVNIFGTWCPNCNDEAPLLARWARDYRDRGLEVVGLAYEFSGDPERDRRQLRRFAERYGIDYPLLLAGTSDKTDAAATLPDLSAVLAYPTTVLIDRRGKVRSIYSGFSGPGTGEHYHRLVDEMEGRLESLLAEPSPETPA